MSAKLDDLNGWPPSADRYDLWNNEASWTAIIHAAGTANRRRNSASAQTDDIWDWHILDLLLKKYGLA